ncbi:MAG TPA: alpha/beta fold hydrolase [Planctomycetes bacterium]|nr:alpha/beta fold hydrolase [Planctomycetota bacterium]
MPPIQVIIHSEGAAMCGSLYLPENAEDAAPGVVFLHGFRGHRIEAGFLFPRMARKLNEAGIAALTFDFRGSGESDGRFEDMTVPGEIKDAHRAVDFMKKVSGVNPARIGVVGYSLGGCVACHVLGERRDVGAAALWAPAVYLDEIIGRRLQEAGLAIESVPAEGIPEGNMVVGKSFFSTADGLDAENACRKSTVPLLVIHGEDDEAVPPEWGRKLVKSLAGHGLKSRYEGIAGGGHGFDNTAAADKLFSLTLAWFKEHLKG